MEIIPPEMIVHRITGDGPINQMIGPMWSVNKWEVLNAIDDELVRRGSYQGKFYEGNAQKEVVSREAWKKPAIFTLINEKGSFHW